MELFEAGRKADNLIAGEVAIQDKMWGDANERADTSNNELLSAAQAQLLFLRMKLEGGNPAEVLQIAKDVCYPKDWDGLRDYGSNVANLVVAVAFLRSEIKRRIFAGESTERSKRTQSYTSASPHMSSDEAASESKTIFHHPV
jgi:hypothetical protein